MGEAMDQRYFVFDELTGAIDDAAAQTFDSIMTAESALAMAFHCSSAQPSQRVAIAFVDEVLALLEKRLQSFAEQSDFDLLFVILRRVPLRVFSLNWLPIVALSLVKYGGRQGGTKLVAQDETTSALQALGPEVFRAIPIALHIAAVARLIDWLQGMRRWIGKGARLRPTKDDPWQIVVPVDVQVAVDAYEARRVGRLFDDRGIYATGLMSEAVTTDNILALSRAPQSLYVYVPERDASRLMNWIALPVDTQRLWAVIEPYREPIETQHRVQLEDVFHVLTAISRLTLSSMRPIKHLAGTGLIYASGNDATSDQRRFEFTSHLLQGAYLRRDEATWIAEISKTATRWAASGEPSRASAERFLSAFLVADRNSIDVPTLRPRPLMVSSRSGGVYFDFASVPDWLVQLIETAQEWYPSVHGDRFHLALFARLKAEGRALNVQRSWPFVDDRGHTRQGDILIQSSKAVICVEAKAFRKTRAYFRGDPGAVRSRTARLRLALDQAEEGARAVSRGSASIDLGERAVFAVVCLPTQEYLRPPDRFGFLAPGVPRVCTPEELLRALASLSE